MLWLDFFGFGSSAGAFGSAGRHTEIYYASELAFQSERRQSSTIRDLRAELAKALEVPEVQIGRDGMIEEDIRQERLASYVANLPLADLAVLMEEGLVERPQDPVREVKILKEESKPAQEDSGLWPPDN